MEVRTFRAASLQEALRQVRQELGPDASVLKTRELREGLFRKPVIEVDASGVLTTPPTAVAATSSATQQTTAPHIAPQQMAPSATIADSAVHPYSNRVEQTLPNTSNPPTPPDLSATRPLPPPVDQETFVPDVEPPHVASPHVASLALEGTNLGAAGLDVLTELIENGVEPRLAKQLLQDSIVRCGAENCQDPWLLKVALSQTIAKRLNVDDAHRIDHDDQRVLAMVGPTGVGKTTSLAKIAAGFRFDLGCDVGFITLDTFRLGAVDQLLHYAELFSAPLEVVSSPDQVTAALARLRECDVVLLDTAGRSPRDTEQLRVLKSFLDAAQPDAVHLVLNACNSHRQIADTVHQFSAVAPSHLLISKLDEAVDFGAWLPVLLDNSLPVSYMTMGQQVPDDIVVASPRRLARELVGGQNTGGQNTVGQNTVGQNAGSQPVSSQRAHQPASRT